MEQEKIKQLLEQYWQCETSREDEQALQKFFSGDMVPEELKIYQPLFAWKNKQKEIRTTKERVFVSKKSSPQKPWMERIYPALKIAASVLVVLVFGISAYTHYRQEQFIDKMFSETYIDSADPIRDSLEVVAKASASVLIPENRTEDSLQLIKPEPRNPAKE
jgi:hypothetical protein